MKTAPQRFDDSFVIRTIRDFFLGLLIIFVIELGARYTLVLWNYETVAKQETRRAAENLAGDLRAIMLNRGGPVAARTVYPILERDHERLGYEIAIEPSADTVKAVEGMMDSKPRGIPPDWSEGPHHEARVAVRAEKFCTACHTRSEPGDTLGWVTVRDYRDSHLELWWQDVRLSGLFAMGNVIIDTIILFVLLRLRMEPILSLRSVVSRLAKAGSDLSHRAPVRSSDEFGQLAHDLNLFLDRVSHIIDDMGRVLQDIRGLSAQMEEVSGAIDAQAARLAGAVGDGRDEAAALDALLEGMEALCHEAGQGGTAARIGALRAEWGGARAGVAVADLRDEMHRIDARASDMQRLEDRMQELAREGERLLGRLEYRRGPDRDGEGGGSDGA